MGQSPEKGRHRTSRGHLPASWRTKLFLATMYDNTYGVLPIREVLLGPQCYWGLSITGAKSHRLCWPFFVWSQSPDFWKLSWYVWLSPHPKSRGMTEDPQVSKVLLFVCLLSYSAVSNSSWPHALYPTSLLCPWDSPGMNNAVGCHALLQGDLPHPGIEPLSLMSPALAGEFFTTSAS